MVVRRGEIRWADLGEPIGSAPGYRRPVVIVQSDGFNESALSTTVVVSVTSNLRLIDAPGNVLLPRRVSGLAKDSVINVSQVVAVDHAQLAERVGLVPGDLMEQVDAGLRLLLS